MITEDQLEQQCLGLFRDGGWETVFGPDIAHDGVAPERANYREVVFVQRLTRSLVRLNPQVPAAVLDEAVQRRLKFADAGAEQANHDATSQAAPCRLRTRPPRFSRAPTLSSPAVRSAGRP